MRLNSGKLIRFAQLDLTNGSLWWATGELICESNRDPAGDLKSQRILRVQWTVTDWNVLFMHKISRSMLGEDLLGFSK